MSPVDHHLLAALGAARGRDDVRLANVDNHHDEGWVTRVCARLTKMQLERQGHALRIARGW